MEDQLTHDIDSLFASFLEAGDESTSAGRLTELIEECIEPLVKALVRGKLHVSLQPTDERQINQDAWDLVSEVKTLIVAKLGNLKSGTVSEGIENLEAYVKTVATNTCNQYLRKKYPHRLRLKNQMRYLLSHDRRFSLWKSVAGDWLCGSREWQEHDPDFGKTELSDQLTDELRQKLDKEGVSPERSNIVDLVGAIFSKYQRPLLFVDLVTLAFQLRGIKEPIEVPEDEAVSGNSLKHESDITNRIEQAEFLKGLWEEIGSLPLRHRAALLLNLRNSHGEGLITLLPLTRVASIRQIAERLEFPIEEFAGVWNELPWDDLTIADHLKLTRQQVINLRQSARATLRRRLNYF